MKTERRGWLALLAGCVLGAAHAADAPLEIDLERSEVRTPCRFVNPSRHIEVFACHEDSPTTHETVVQFAATGPQLFRALVAIGCRPASFWNATSPHDFLRNQGDRVLVLVRWSHDGVEHEMPAEGMLYDVFDGESGFPAFLRGFSFGARLPEEGTEPEVTPGGEPRDGSEGGQRGGGGATSTAAGGGSTVPREVEITLGASNRQSPSYSLLAHPTSLPRLRDWVLPPTVNTAVVGDLPELVRQQTPATLVLRRLPSEEALLDAARALALRRGTSERLALHERLRPVARRIDALKGEYAGIRSELEEIVSGGGASADAIPALLQRGQSLCARIEERYLTLFALQEEYKRQWVERRSELAVEVGEEARSLVEAGIAIEVLLARKEIELATHRATREGDAAADSTGDALVREIEKLRARRQLRMVQADELREAWSLEQATNPYSREIFREGVMRAKAATAYWSAKVREIESHIDELHARAAGRWDDEQSAILARRQRASDEIALARLEGELVKVIEETRWARNDVESRFADRREHALRELDELDRRGAALRSRIDALREGLH